MRSAFIVTYRSKAKLTVEFETENTVSTEVVSPLALQPANLPLQGIGRCRFEKFNKEKSEQNEESAAHRFLVGRLSISCLLSPRS